MAATTEQLQILRPVVLRITILVMNRKRDVARDRMDPVPTTLLTFAAGSFKEPTAHMVGNSTVAPPSRNLAP